MLKSPLGPASSVKPSTSAAQHVFKQDIKHSTGGFDSCTVLVIFIVVAKLSHGGTLNTAMAAMRRTVLGRTINIAEASVAATRDTFLFLAARAAPMASNLHYYKLRTTGNRAEQRMIFHEPSTVAAAPVLGRT